MKNNNFNIGDVVRIKRGIYEGQLALVIDKLNDEVFYKVKIILNGMESVYKNTTMIFCYNNDDKSIKVWEHIIEYNQQKLIKCYNDIKYIRDNFDIDIFIANDIVINTIFKYARIKRYDIFEWFYDNKIVLSVIFHYNEAKFVLEYCRLIDKTISEEEILRLHKAAWS